MRLLLSLVLFSCVFPAFSPAQMSSGVTVISNWPTTQTVTLVSSPLATGACTDTTLATRATESTLATRASESTLSLLNAKIPSDPAQDRITAVAPAAIRISNGTTFVTPTTPADTQPVTAVSLPLPTGAATSALQATGNTSVASIDTKTPALVGGRVPVDGSGVTNPVSVASLPLPTGAATETTLGTRASEATLATRATETTLSTRATETTLSAINTKMPALVSGRQPVDASGVTLTVSCASGCSSPTQAQTYTASVQASAAGASKDFLAIFNSAGSGKVISLLSIRINADLSAVVTGVNQSFRVNKTSSAGITCTGVTINPNDTANAAVPSQVTAITNCTTDPVIAFVIGGCTITGEETAAQTRYPCYEFAASGGQPIVVREGQGISLVSTALSGAWPVTVTFEFSM